LVENYDERIIRFLVEEKALIKILDRIETEKEILPSYTPFPKRSDNIKITNNDDIWIN
jgi:hypothetical protein